MKIKNFSVFITLLIPLVFISCSQSKKTADNSILAKVKYNGSYGFIGKDGNWAIEPSFDMAKSFSEGHASFVKGGKKVNGAVFNGLHGYMDKNGKVVIEPEYTRAFGFSEGFAVVEKNMKHFGFINKEGKIIKEGFSELYPFSGGLAIALDRKNGIIGHVDTKGDWKIKYRYIKEVSKLGYFYEGLALIIKPSGDRLLYGFINKNGDEVIPAVYENALNFSEGLAWVKKDGKYGFIDKKGKMIKQPEFDNAGYFHGGFAIVKVGGEYGYVNRKGDIVIKPQFKGCGDFSEGLAFFVKNGKVGFLDKTGKVVIKEKFDRALGFSEGLSAVLVEGKVGFIDKKGAWAIEPKFEIAQSFFKVNGTTPPSGF